MNTRFLETFVTLSELRNYRATARALHATPAAISLRVKSLEDELGAELVDRESKEFRLTPQGESLLAHARTVVAAAKRLQAAARQDNTIRGRLRLGVIETVVHSWLSPYIKRMSKEYPELEIDLTVDRSTVLQKRLQANELDLIVRVEGSDNPDIVSTALAVYPVQWFAHRSVVRGNAKGQKALVKWALQQPLLTFSRGTAPQRAMEKAVAHLASQQDVPLSQTRITCSPSVAAIVRLLLDGYGIAAIPSLFVNDHLKTGDIVNLPALPSLPVIIVTLCHPAETEMKVHAAATVARQACADYGAQLGESLIGVLC
ncbi:LysR family transcriptional regulator [Noviherbaspirillum pedocola]|uniref:LysR family transcriptional regulator n=1 Tax=Noviherbaspirillum pedocola TaxID=2801341 RepID=A0A934W991_9BURK|nr:LysR family transcriptional regulator [Noviherbaspirillum pedocola]MBK4737788.1 LysR family transcriptional regulator [Noviherbaspirillum pedocola]